AKPLEAVEHGVVAQTLVGEQATHHGAGAADAAPAVDVHAAAAEPVRDQVEHQVVVRVVDHAEVRDREGLVAQVEDPGGRGGLHDGGVGGEAVGRRGQIDE